ncbi:MAG: AMP-binding protein, partial [Gammaproteobacteria bacterium]|nr:AMP-binding protein [Gammaproteobacteria bacterium]
MFEIFLVDTHLIADGISNQIIMREFVDIYSAYTEERTPAGISYDLDDYQKVVNVINGWHDRDELASFEKLLKQQGRKSFVWNPNSSEVRRIKAPVKSPRYAIDENITSRLIANTKEWRISLASFLISAYLLTIKKLDPQQDSIILNLPTSGRIYPGIDALDLDAFGMVGCFAQNLSLTFELPGDGEDLSAVLHRVHKTFQDALSSGYDRAQMLQIRSLNNLPLTPDGILRPEVIQSMRTELKSNVYLSIIGQTGIEKEYGQMKVADYQALSTNVSTTIDTVVEMIHGRIQFTLNHDETFYSARFIKKFGKELIRQVNTLSELTPQPETPVEIIQSTVENTAILEQIRQIGENILHISIAQEAMNKDLEADLGMDSLERIRIVTRIRDSIQGVSALTLMECRSLAEMAGTIGPTESKGVVAAGSEENVEMPYQKIIYQCKTRPNEIAIIYESTQMTYGELHSTSNRLAHYLRQHGIHQGSFVGLMTNRGPQMLIGLLGILKAGGTYIPIDPRYPSGRITYMIDHAKMSILLTEPALSPLIEQCTQDISALQRLVLVKEGELALEQSGVEVVSQNSWMESSDADIDYVNTPDDLMVVLYTSGSTGKPKGVMLNHRGYTNRINWHQKVFQLSPGERVAQKTSCSFDISVWELFWPLMEGGILCPVENDIVKNPWRLAQWLNDTNINIMHFVPSMFGEFVTALEGEPATFPDLRWLIFSGEALPIPYIQKWIDTHGLRTGLANLYGPTEASIDVTSHIITKRPADEELRIPIGKAIDNTYMLVL